MEEGRRGSRRERGEKVMARRDVPQNIECRQCGGVMNIDISRAAVRVGSRRYICNCGNVEYVKMPRKGIGFK